MVWKEENENYKKQFSIGNNNLPIVKTKADLNN